MSLTFLAPVALAALAVPVAIYVIHWLFGTRRRMQVPALFLWADLPGLRTGRNRRRLPWPAAGRPRCRRRQPSRPRRCPCL